MEEVKISVTEVCPVEGCKLEANYIVTYPKGFENLPAKKKQQARSKAKRELREILKKHHEDGHPRK